MPRLVEDQVTRAAARRQCQEGRRGGLQRMLGIFPGRVAIRIDAVAAQVGDISRPAIRGEIHRMDVRRFLAGLVDVARLITGQLGDRPQRTIGGHRQHGQGAARIDVTRIVGHQQVAGIGGQRGKGGVVAQRGNLVLQGEPMLRIQRQCTGAADHIARTGAVFIHRVHVLLVRGKHQPGRVVQTQLLPGFRVQPAAVRIEPVRIQAGVVALGVGTHQQVDRRRRNGEREHTHGQRNQPERRQHGESPDGSTKSTLLADTQDRPSLTRQDVRGCQRRSMVPADPKRRADGQDATG